MEYLIQDCRPSKPSTLLDPVQCHFWEEALQTLQNLAVEYEYVIILQFLTLTKEKDNF